MTGAHDQYTDSIHVIAAQDATKSEKDQNAIFEEDGDVDMDIDNPEKATANKKGAAKRQRRPSSPRVEKKRHRRAKNSIVFPMRHLKSKKGKKR